MYLDTLHDPRVVDVYGLLHTNRYEEKQVYYREVVRKKAYTSCSVLVPLPNPR